MKKFTLMHFVRIYSLVLSVALIPVLFKSLPEASIDVAVGMIFIWVMGIVMFAISHMAIRYGKREN